MHSELLSSLAVSPLSELCPSDGPQDRSGKLVKCASCGCTGPEAQELLKQLKRNSPHASLIEFTRLHPHFSTQSGYASVLSTQSHAVDGSMVNTLLVQHIEPDTLLTAQQVSVTLKI